MSRAGFIDVAGITPMPATREGPVTDGIVVKDFAGRVVESLLITPDGHFRGTYGKVHRDDVGEYIVRVAGHPSRGSRTRESVRDS